MSIQRLGAVPAALRDAGKASATSPMQFHYYRLTADNRILWGGYDAACAALTVGRRHRHLDSFLRPSTHRARRPRRLQRRLHRLGVGASRFGAQMMRDLLDGIDSEALALEAVRSQPLPFPPEPVRWAGISLTRRALAPICARAGAGRDCSCSTGLGMGS